MDLYESKRKKKKKKKKEEEEENIEAENETSSQEVAQFPNWAELQPDLLGSILVFLTPSLPDRLAFSAVCKPWRSFSKSSTATIPSPPFLLCPNSNPRRPDFQCRLKALTLGATSFISNLSTQTLNRKYVGHSHGHLILTCSHALIADPLTGAEIRSPNLPALDFSMGILTAPLSSSSCALLLVCTDQSTLCLWSLGENCNRWSTVELDKKVESLVVFKEQVYGLCSRGTTFILEFPPLSPKWKMVPVSRELPPLPEKPDRLHLVECGNELLLVIVIFPKICVYRMDFSDCEWKEVKSLGDWCLFMDSISICPIAGPNPTKWGGENNSIYVAGVDPFHIPRVDPDTWTVLPFVGSAVLGATLYCQWMKKRRHHGWPLSVWVYPSMLI